MTLVVVVHIIDENDNRPAFNQLTYVGHVSEGSPDGSVVLTDDSVPLILDADDKDSNLNALLLYSILEPEARVYFRIDSNTGAIRTATTPNRELKGRFEFTVQVQDQGMCLVTCWIYVRLVHECPIACQSFSDINYYNPNPVTDSPIK